LKRKCLKWSCITHLNIWSTRYDQKKGRESNWQFDSRSLKVRNQPNFLAWRQCAMHHWKSLNKGYNFVSDLIAIKGLHAKLWAPKVAGVPVVGILGLPLGSPRTKSHLDVPPMESYKVYFKGEGDGFPQVQAVVNLVSSSCSWLVLAPKVLQLCTNHLVLVLCKFVWVIEACPFFLVPSQSSNTALYPSKMRRARECASTPYSFVVFSFDSHLSPSRSWEHVNCMKPDFCLSILNRWYPHHGPYEQNYPYFWPPLITFWPN
jgi:hypothetical protein